MRGRASDGEWYDGVDGDEVVRGRSTISRAMRRQLYLRDHARCSVPGCRARRHLHVHHIQYRSRGGGNELSNLTLVCSAHHAAIHDGKLAVTGAAPHGLVFTGVDGRPYGMERTAALERSRRHRERPVAPPDDARDETDAYTEARSAMRNRGFPARIADAAVQHAGRQMSHDASTVDIVRAARHRDTA